MKIHKITLLGHKDHGKSTLIGNLLIKSGTATEDRINEARKISEELGRPFEPGFLLDSFVEERQDAMTIDTTRVEIKFKDIAFELIDVPGHEELIKNMISGASYASAALLVVSAKPDEGIRDQTKRHVFIAKTLGINRLVVAVNKMDTINFNKESFENVIKELEVFFDRIGFDKSNIIFVPTSAYTGDNLIEKTEKASWYEGKALLDTLYDVATKPEPDAPKDMRMIVQGTLDGEQNEQLVVGKILSGKLSAGDKVVILPKGEELETKSIIVKGEHVNNAKRGDNVALDFGKTMDYNVRGTVISSIPNKPLVAKTLDALIFATAPLGKDMHLKLNGNDAKANKLDMKEIINCATGIATEGTEVTPLNAARVKIELDNVTVAEKFSNLPELGRFTLYSGREFAGFGIIE